MAGLIVILVWFCKKLSSIRLLSESKIHQFMLFEGRNSLTILGVHMLIMAGVSLVLNRIMPQGWIFLIIQFVVVVFVSNICILLFNRFVPFLVNHKR